MGGDSSHVIHSDRALARRILRGDEAAFRDVFDRYFPRLYRFALARLDGNSHEAKEVVQQTFCKAIEHLDAYRGEASLYAWLCQICRNNIMDSGRRKARESSHISLLEEDGEIRAVLDVLSAPDSDRPDRAALRSDLVRLIQATLDSLPNRYGDVLEWKYVDGMTVKEIAQRLGVGPKAAESLLTRSRGAFRSAVAAVAGAHETFESVLKPQSQSIDQP